MLRCMVESKRNRMKILTLQPTRWEYWEGEKPDETPFDCQVWSSGLGEWIPTRHSPESWEKSPHRWRVPDYRAYGLLSKEKQAMLEEARDLGILQVLSDSGKSWLPFRSGDYMYGCETSCRP